jgi:hypothetical protein
MSESKEMPIEAVEYMLQDGFVHNWLVAGPLAMAVENLDEFEGTDFKSQIAHFYYQTESGISGPAAEKATGEATFGDDDPVDLVWQSVICGDDHFVDLSDFYHTCHYLRAWAFIQIDAPSARSASLEITTNGPADIWINGQHVHRHLHFHHQIPQRVFVQADLAAGKNDVLIRIEEVAVRECPYALALRILDDDRSNFKLFLPTTLQPLARRRKLEDLMAGAVLTQDVYQRNDELVIYWPDDFRLSGEITVRLQSKSGRIYGEGNVNVAAGAKSSFGQVISLPEGPYDLLLMPKAEEYYIGGMRVTRRLPFHVVQGIYHETPTDTFAERKLEALYNAAGRENNIFAEIAKIALGRWQQLNAETILSAIDDINRRADCSDFYLVGLLGMMIRYMDEPEFPGEIKSSLEHCVLSFRY